LIVVSVLLNEAFKGIVETRAEIDVNAITVFVQKIVAANLCFSPIVIKRFVVDKRSPEQRVVSVVQVEAVDFEVFK
jgi:hypothetical protein